MFGSVVSWDNTTPAGSESVALGDDRIRSAKSGVQTAFADEHIFPASGGTAGLHMKGSARAFFGAQSLVSASTTSAPAADGRMMIASDTSRLFGVGSEGTVLLGGSTVPSFGSAVAITRPQRAYIAMERGLGLSDVNGEFTIAFPNSGFSDIPQVFTQMASANTIRTRVTRLLSTTASQFTGMTVETSTGAVISTYSFDWLAIGTRTL